MANKLTLKQTALRIISGTQSQVAIKEHIDAWNKSFDTGLYADEPPLTGQPHLDAWLAGAAHYEAFLIDEEPPAWVNAPARFLTDPFFSGGQNSRAIALVETPFPFRMRMVFSGKSFIKSPTI